MNSSKKENKLNIANGDINTSAINEINENSSIHSLVFNNGFQSNSSPNIRRNKYYNNLSINSNSLITINHVQSNELSNDGLFQFILKNESATSSNSFNINNFNLNDNTNINKSNSDIIVNDLFNPSPKININEKKNNNINTINMKEDNRVKAMEKILLKKRLI